MNNARMLDRNGSGVIAWLFHRQYTEPHALGANLVDAYFWQIYITPNVHNTMQYHKTNVFLVKMKTDHTILQYSYLRYES